MGPVDDVPHGPALRNLAVCDPAVQGRGGSTNLPARYGSVVPSRKSASHLRRSLPLGRATRKRGTHSPGRRHCARQVRRAECRRDAQDRRLTSKPPVPFRPSVPIHPRARGALKHALHGCGAVERGPPLTRSRDLVRLVRECRGHRQPAQARPPVRYSSCQESEARSHRSLEPPSGVLVSPRLGAQLYARLDFGVRAALFLTQRISVIGAHPGRTRRA